MSQSFVSPIGQSSPKESALSSTKESLVTSGGKAWLCRFEGQVLHADRSFETHVSSSGGGGSVGPGGGYVAAPQLSSQTTDHQTIFVRAKDGTERSFEWRDWNLPVRPGSTVAVVWGGRNGTEVGPFLGARNLDTGEERWRDVQQWARNQGLLSGKMRVWPSLLVAGMLGGAFTLLVAFARAHASGAGDSEHFAGFLLATAIALVPVVILEWLFAIAIRVGDVEHQRIQRRLSGHLLTGVLADA